MLIAAAVDDRALTVVIPEKFEDSTKLYIVETDLDKVLHIYERCDEDGVFFARMAVRHDCEAIVCGKMQRAAFEVIAENSITRYYGSGLEPLEAAKAAEWNLLPFITDYEGGTGCGSHEVNRCEEHLRETGNY